MGQARLSDNLRHVKINLSIEPGHQQLHAVFKARNHAVLEIKPLLHSRSEREIAGPPDVFREWRRDNAILAPSRQGVATWR